MLRVRGANRDNISVGLAVPGDLVLDTLIVQKELVTKDWHTVAVEKAQQRWGDEFRLAAIVARTIPIAHIANIYVIHRDDNRVAAMVLIDHP